MSGGMTNYAANAVLNGTPIPLTLFLKFHIGDPGPDALLNVASHATRKQLDFVDSDTLLRLWNDAAASWPGISVTETVPYFSLWDDVSAGNPWFIGEFLPSFELVASSTATVNQHTIFVDAIPYGV